MVWELCRYREMPITPLKKHTHKGNNKIHLKSSKNTVKRVAEVVENCHRMVQKATEENKSISVSIVGQ